METQQKTNYMIPVSIVIAGVLIAGAVFLTNKKGDGAAPIANGQQEPNIEKMRAVSSSDHILGNPNAKVVIVEYSDTECPFCKQYHETLKQVIDAYGKNGDVAWVYRHYPIAELHSKSEKEAEATECAASLGGNNKFWEYTDALYDRTNSNNSLDPAELPKIAKDIGLNVDAFNSCLSSGKFASKVQAYIQEGQTVGIRGTPFSVLVSKDVKVPITRGAVPFSILKSSIDAILAGKTQ